VQEATLLGGSFDERRGDGEQAESGSVVAASIRAEAEAYARETGANEEVVRGCCGPEVEHSPLFRSRRFGGRAQT
jgi:hypothetical protein